MQVRNVLRKKQKAITDDFKSRALKAEQILGEIEACEKTIAALNDALSTVLGISVETTVVAINNASPAKVAKVKKTAKTKSARPKAVVSRSSGASQKDCVRKFLLQAAKPMNVAEIVAGMQKAGQPLQAKRPVKALRKLLYRDPQIFKRVNPGTFTAV